MSKSKSHITEENFRRYLQNEMSDSERNHFERELQKNPFEAEALEGFQQISPAEMENDLEELRNKILAPKRRKKYYWTAAASVLLLIAAGFVFFLLNKEPETTQMAELKTESQPPEEKIVPTPQYEEPLKEDAVPPKVNESVETEEESEITTGEIAVENKRRTKIAAVRENGAGDTGLVYRNPASENRTTEEANNKRMAKSVQAAAFKNETLQHTEVVKPMAAEKAAFSIQSDDVFPDSFSSAIQDREKIQIVQGIAVQDQVEAEDDEMLPDLKAHPVTGMQQFEKYLEKEAVLPKSFRRKKATVNLLLSIDAKGNITEIKKTGNSDSLLFEMAKRIIENGPDWNPEVINEQKINSEVPLKITFSKK